VIVDELRAAIDGSAIAHREEPIEISSRRTHC